MDKNVLINDKDKINFNTNIFYFLKNSFILSYVNMNWSLNYLFAFIFINLHNNPQLTSYFSFSITLFSILASQVSLGFSEILGIEISKLRGMNKIIDCYKIMIKYFFIMIIFIIGKLILIYFIKYILVLIQIDEELIENSLKIIYYSIPYLIIMPFNKSIESLFISFNKKMFLFYSYNFSYLILIIFLFIGYYFNFTLFLFPFAKILQEIYFLIINLYYLNKEFISLIDFIQLWKYDEIKKNFLINSFRAFKIVIGINFELLSFEINIIYLGIKNNKNDISIWAAFVNFTSLIFFFSLGIANSIRTEIGYYLGANKPNIARSFFSKIFKNYLFILYVFAIFQALFSYYIGYLYFNDEFTLIKFSYLFKYYIIVSGIDLIKPLLYTICRIIERINFYIISHLLINPILMIFFGYFFIIYLDLGSIGCLINFSIAHFSISAYLFYGYYYGDFKKGIKLNL